MLSIDLKGKTALVCGASKGIGKSIALQFAQCGASVVLLSRNKESLENCLLLLDKTMGQEHGYLCADMSKPYDVFEKASKYFVHRPTHIIINNSGGPPAGKLYEAEIAALDAAFQQHVINAQQLMKILLPGMKELNYGRIINIISTSVKQPLENLGVSNTIRGAMASWAKTLANELGQYNITVNNILPGATETDRLVEIINKESSLHNKSIEEVRTTLTTQIPIKRFGLPEEIAYAAAFLASPLASYINGINLPIDGGRTKSL